MATAMSAAAGTLGGVTPTTGPGVAAVAGLVALVKGAGLAAAVAVAAAVGFSSTWRASLCSRV